LLSGYRENGVRERVFSFPSAEPREACGRGIQDYAPGTPGFFPYGELRGAPNVLTMRASAPLRIGQASVLTIEGGPPSAAGFLSVSAAEAEAAAFGGCQFVDFVQEAARLVIACEASGTATVALNIPNSPNFVSAERFLQAFVHDAAQPQGWAMSHGLRVLLRQ